MSWFTELKKLGSEVKENLNVASDELSVKLEKFNDEFPAKAEKFSNDLNATLEKFNADLDKISAEMKADQAIKRTKYIKDHMQSNGCSREEAEEWMAEIDARIKY